MITLRHLVLIRVHVWMIPKHDLPVSIGGRHSIEVALRLLVRGGYLVSVRIDIYAYLSSQAPFWWVPRPPRAADSAIPSSISCQWTETSSASKSEPPGLNRCRLNSKRKQPIASHLMMKPPSEKQVPEHQRTYSKNTTLECSYWQIFGAAKAWPNSLDR